MTVRAQTPKSYVTPTLLTPTSQWPPRLPSIERATIPAPASTRHALLAAAPPNLPIRRAGLSYHDYPADRWGSWSAPVAAVEKSRCVKGKPDVAAPAVTYQAVRPSALRDLWHSSCRSKPTAQRYITKKLTPHRALHDKRRGIVFKGFAVRSTFLVSPWFFYSNCA
jgi:hypothetical protein